MYNELSNGINWNNKDTVLIADSLGKKVNIFKIDFEQNDRT